MRTVGVIAAPGWIDPTATDIMACWPNQVQVTQTILGPAGFDYSFAALAECEPYLREAAQILVETGAEIVVQVGPAFAYLAGCVPDGQPLPMPETSDVYLDCTIRGRRAQWQEKAEMMSLTASGRTLYEWRKGEPWAGVVAPEVMWK